MAETQDTIELRVVITALDPSETFDEAETLEQVATLITDPDEADGPYAEDGYVVVVSKAVDQDADETPSSHPRADDEEKPYVLESVRGAFGVRVPEEGLEDPTFLDTFGSFPAAVENVALRVSLPYNRPSAEEVERMQTVGAEWQFECGATIYVVRRRS